MGESVRRTLGPPTGGEMNEIGVLMFEVDRWRDSHPGYTPQQELGAFSPSKLYQRALESPCDTVRLYNHFMRAIGYVVKKEI